MNGALENKQKTTIQNSFAGCIYHNGTYINTDSFNLKFDNRCFQYGDGIFETMVAENGKINFLKDHLERLENSLEVLNIDGIAVLKPNLIDSVFKNLVIKNSFENHIAGCYKLKLQVWRKAGGLYTPASNGGEFSISISRIEKQSIIKNNLSFYNDIHLSYSIISSLKTCNSLPYIMASVQKQKLGLDDMILSTANGFVSESISSNIFWINGKTMFTPSIKTGCINGIMRKQILKASGQLNIDVKIGEFDKKNLLGADAVFTSNVTGLSPVKKIDDKEFSVEVANDYIHQLKTIYENY